MSSLTSPVSDVQSTPTVQDACDLIIPPDDAAVWDAVQSNQAEVLKDLIHAKADVNAIKEGKLLLEEALSHADLAVARLLLEARADTRPCFTRLIRSSSGDALKTLIEANADVNTVLENRLKFTPLHEAALTGKVEIMQVLLQAGANLEARDWNGNTPLATVMTFGDKTDGAKFLIEAKASLDALNDNELSILMIAARYGRLEKFKLIFDQNPNVDLEMRDSAGNTVLCHAADAGCVEVMSFLLSAKASIDACNNEGRNPLWLAACSAAVDAVQALVDAGASLAGACDNKGDTLICAAAMRISYSNEAMLRYLLSANASVHEENYSGQGPLFRAVENDLDVVEEIRYLIAAGAPVNKPDNDGNTPLMVAARNARVETLQELIKAKANVNILNNNKESPLFLATKYKHSNHYREKTIQLLLDAKANLEMRLMDHETVLSFIAWEDDTYTPVFKQLVAAKASVNVVDEHGNLILSRVAHQGILPAVERLLAARAQPDLCDDKGASALMFASVRGHTDVIKALLIAKASPNLITKGGRTALCYAAASARMPDVQLLLNAGAKPDLPRVIPSALWEAAKRGHAGIVEQLINAKASMSAAGSDFSPFLAAIRSGAPDVVRIFLDARAHLEKRGTCIDTALLLAAMEGKAEVVSLLVDAKASLDATDAFGGSPLKRAVQFGHVAVVQVLLDAGASLDTKSGTVVHTAAQDGQAEMLKLLISRKASLTAVNKQRLTPLEVAERNGNADAIDVLRAALGLAPVARVVEKTPTERLFEALSTNAKAHVIRDLLASKAEIEHRDAAGNTPLQVATRHNHLLGAALLLAKKADVEACNTRGLSPLMLATMNASGKHGALIDKLLGAKADVNKRNPQGKTPLMMAVYHGNASVVSKLLSANADVCVVDDQGNTALSLAVRNGVSHIVDMLQAAKASIAKSG